MKRRDLYPALGYLIVVVSVFSVATAVAEFPAYTLDWASVAGNQDNDLLVHGVGAFTEVYGGIGRVLQLNELPGTASVAGNPPPELDFQFGSADSLIVGAPALTLTGFDNSSNVVVQEFTATGDNELKVFNLGQQVANGIVLDVRVMTPPTFVSTATARFQLTDDAGGDPTIFNETLALSGGTGIMTVALSDFRFGGLFLTDPGIFVSEGLGAPGNPAGLTPDNPLLPSSINGRSFVFEICEWTEGIRPPLYFDPEVAIGYDYEVDSTEFVSILLPDLGDGEYELHLWDGAEYVFETTITAGTIFPLDAYEISRFRVLGIEESVGLDPTDPTAFVTGLNFKDNIDTTMTMTPIVVPEPNAAILIAVALGACLRRRM